MSKSSNDVKPSSEGRAVTCTRFADGWELTAVGMRRVVTSMTMCWSPISVDKHGKRLVAAAWADPVALKVQDATPVDHTFVPVLNATQMDRPWFTVGPIATPDDAVVVR